jgi:hypothetical protein
LAQEGYGENYFPSDFLEPEPIDNELDSPPEEHEREDYAYKKDPPHGSTGGGRGFPRVSLGTHIFGIPQFFSGWVLIIS